MKKLISIIFPIRLQLNIFQLEEYKYSRFLKWIAIHFLTRTNSVKKPLVTTQKVKLIIYFSLLWLIIAFLAITLLTNLLMAIIISIVMLSQPYLLFGLSLLILKPYEIINRKKVIESSRNTILSAPNLKIIAISGSFGKSSTKEILYQLIKDEFKTLKTPESYNTVFGVAKVIDLEFDPSYEYFICEMAAYIKGDINELCHMAPPRYGIITGIAKQHLERFGNLKNIIEAKFELYENVSDKNNMSFNLDDPNITHELNIRRVANPYGFGLQNKNAAVRLDLIKFDKNGTSFNLIINNKNYPVSTKLFGYSNAKNILAAVSMALKIGLKPQVLVQKIKALTPASNRFVLTKLGSATMINNTYSSNTQSFNEIINTAKQIEGRKVLVTPGLIELGREESQIHLEIGKNLQGVFDLVILVGKNNKTVKLSRGLGNKKCEFIDDTRESYWNKINNLSNKFDWIFLENDLPQNY